MWRCATASSAEVARRHHLCIRQDGIVGVAVRDGMLVFVVGVGGEGDEDSG